MCFVVDAIDNHCGRQGRAETLRFMIFTSFWCFGDSITIIVNLGVQGRAETLRFASGSEAVIRRCSDCNRFHFFTLMIMMVMVLVMVAMMVLMVMMVMVLVIMLYQ